MKKILPVLFVLISVSVFAEEALVLPERTLRYTQSVYFGFQSEDGELNGEAAEKIMALGWGEDIEFGVTDQLNFQFLNDPGFWGVFKGAFGSFSDMYIGVKGYLLGKNALFHNETGIRFSTAVGIKIPVNEIIDPNNSVERNEPDQLLWGTSLRAYGDFIANGYFFFNVYAEGIFYPPQRTSNSAFAGGEVKHYLDITGEIEPRFSVPLGESGITLTGGAPVRLFYAPVMDSADNSVSDQYCFSAGARFGVFFTDVTNPVEISLRYNAPILGRNVTPIHRVSLVFRIYNKKNEKLGNGE